MNLEALVLAGFVAMFCAITYTGIWLKNILLEMARGIEGQLNSVESAVKTIQASIDRIAPKTSN